MASDDRLGKGMLFLGPLLLVLGLFLLLKDDFKSSEIIIGHALIVLLGAALLALGISLRLNGRREN